MYLMNTQRPRRNNFDPEMPLNIESCLGVKTDLKHNSAASVLPSSSSRFFIFFLRKQSPNWLKAEQRERAEGVCGRLWSCSSSEGCPQGWEGSPEKCFGATEQYFSTSFFLFWTGLMGSRIPSRNPGVWSPGWVAEILVFGKQKVRTAGYYTDGGEPM